MCNKELDKTTYLYGLLIEVMIARLWAYEFYLFRLDKCYLSRLDKFYL